MKTDATPSTGPPLHPLTSTPISKNPLLASRPKIAIPIRADPIFDIRHESHFSCCLFQVCVMLHTEVAR